VGLEEEWRVSKVSYSEVVFRPVVQAGYTSRDLGSVKAVRRIVLGASINKAIFAAFTTSGALFPFLVYATGLLPIALSVAVSLSILLVFGYVVLYCVQILPSFVSTGSFLPLTVLPLAPSSVSRVALLTLWRALDYIFYVSFLSLVLTAAYFTESVAATLVIGLTAVSSFVLAVGLALWLTDVFQRRLESGGVSGLRALARPLYFALWGLGVMSAVFIFSLVSYVAPPIQSALSTPDSVPGIVLPLILPFSAGVVSQELHGQSIPQLTLMLGLAGLGIGGAVSVAASKAILGVVTSVVLPSKRLGQQLRRASLSFRIRKPLGGYILKDIRVASRNPATGFIFALPIFVVIAVAVPLAGTPIVKMSALLAGAQVGGGFAIFAAFLLVTVEDFGVERRTALPFSESVRTLSKALISTGCYLPAPVSFSLVLLLKPSTFALGSFAIPVLGTLSVFAGCIIEVSVIRALAENGRGTAFRFSAGIGTGEVTMLLPSIAYAVAYVLSRNHIEALGIFVSITAVELVVAYQVLRRRVGQKAGA